MGLRLLGACVSYDEEGAIDPFPWDKATGTKRLASPYVFEASEATLSFML
jgi:hypothetical protein